MNITLIVEVETNNQWLIVNKREIKEGMSEKERASVIEEIAMLRMQWEASDVFRGSPLRINILKRER